MTPEPAWFAAVLVALAGAGHCAAMCGPIVGALAWTRPGGASVPVLAGYNLGRVASYAVAGALAGAMGGWLTDLLLLHHAQRVLQVVAGLFMLLLAGWLAGVWTVLRHVERAGGLLWRVLEPLGRRLLPVRSGWHAVAVGAVWGWLPCGLVYSVLVWAMSAGSAASGAVLMLAFGVGTLPALLAMGAGAAGLVSRLRTVIWRRAAAVLVAALGLWQITAAMVRVV